MSILNKKLRRDLYKFKGQVITIALVVCSGISVLVSSFTAYQSLSIAQTRFYANYGFADIFATLKQAPDYLAKRINEISGVAEVETRIVEDVILDLPGVSEPAIGRFISVPDVEKSRLNKLYLRKGRWLAPNRYHETLVNESFAEANAIKPGDRIEALLSGHREILQIVGIVLSPEYIYAIRGEDLLPDNKHFGVFWMNRTALSAAFGKQQAFNDISLRLAPDASERYVRSALEKSFLKYGLSIAYTRQDQISDRFVTNKIRQQKIIATFMPPIFLVVAAFLLNLVTSRLVHNQRSQIATLKSLGYDNITIVWYYIKFVAVIVLLGASLGTILGAWFARSMNHLYAEYFRFPIFTYSFSITSVWVGVFVSFLAALSGAMRAVYQVIHLAPAIAMRPPTPASYRLLTIEKLPFLSHLPASVKMFYRYLLRHFFRTLLTTIGISLAVAIVILGLFWQDAIHYLINTQFFISQKEDAKLFFTEPLQDRILNEINKMPGILFSEAYRATPVRLSYQHYIEQASLYGIPLAAKLKVVLDEDAKKIPIPKYGVVLSEGLAERLHVKEGTKVHVQLLEGNRASVELPVYNVTNDYVGAFAYTDIALVNYLLREDHLINFVSATVDPRYVHTLYQKIKTVPKITSIVFKKSIIDIFEKTFAEHILAFTSILTGFAMTIAVGVIYNNVMITLTERSWELATLRVLGFTEREVTNMFFYSVLLEVLFSLPIGGIFGYWLSWIILHFMQTDWFKIPFVITSKTYSVAMGVVLLSGLLSFFVIRRKIKQFDLTAVLKVGD